jgi:hypothetical protein
MPDLALGKYNPQKPPVNDKNAAHVVHADGTLGGGCCFDPLFLERFERSGSLAHTVSHAAFAWGIPYPIAAAVV